MPAIAVSPTRFIKVIVIPRERAGMLSRMYTLKMIPSLEQPIDCAASIRPGFTPASAASAWREKNGTVPTMSGKIEPATPMEVPLMIRVSGISRNSRIMNGTERRRLIMMSSTR